jgi:hypothetical protein
VFKCELAHNRTHSFRRARAQVRPSREDVRSFRCVREPRGRPRRPVDSATTCPQASRALSAISTLRLLSRRLGSKSQRVSRNATSGWAIEELSCHWHDIPAAISPQKPHSVAVSAGRLSRRGPCACSSSRKANRIAVAKSAADSRMGNLVRMVSPWHLDLNLQCDLSLSGTGLVLHPSAWTRRRAGGRMLVSQIDSLRDLSVGRSHQPRRVASNLPAMPAAYDRKPRMAAH